jgi:hypothetical protein
LTFLTIDCIEKQKTELIGEVYLVLLHSSYNFSKERKKITKDIISFISTYGFRPKINRYLNSVQVAKTHLSFATAFFHISEPNKGTKGPKNHSLG